jgi:hypothetical protein
VWEAYTPEQSEIIERGWRARQPVVKLPRMTHLPKGNQDFEIRFAEASQPSNSSSWPLPKIFGPAHSHP